MFVVTKGVSSNVSLPVVYPNTLPYEFQGNEDFYNKMQDADQIFLRMNDMVFFQGTARFVVDLTSNWEIVVSTVVIAIGAVVVFLLLFFIK